MNPVNKKEEYSFLETDEGLIRKELELLKKELNKQLNLREKELQDYLTLQKKYELLENKYHAIRNSLLGRVTIKYWGFKKRLSQRNDKK